MTQDHDEENSNSAQQEKERKMSELLHGKDIRKERILAYQTKAPAPPDVSIVVKYQLLLWIKS